MTQLLETAFKKASALPDRVQDKLAKELLVRIEEQTSNSPEANGERPFVSAYDLAKDLIGSIEGTGDLSTNPEYLQDLGENSLS